MGERFKSPSDTKFVQVGGLRHRPDRPGDAALMLPGQYDAHSASLLLIEDWPFEDFAKPRRKRQPETAAWWPPLTDDQLHGPLFGTSCYEDRPALGPVE